MTDENNKKTKRPFRVALMRPIFQVALLPVEASSEKEAAIFALNRADKLSDQDWLGKFDGTRYEYDVLEAIDLGETESARAAR